MFFLSASGAQKKHRFEIFINRGAAAGTMLNRGFEEIKPPNALHPMAEGLNFEAAIRPPPTNFPHWKGLAGRVAKSGRA
jgi:hypothetical protein